MAKSIGYEFEKEVEGEIINILFRKDTMDFVAYFDGKEFHFDRWYNHTTHLIKYIKEKQAKERCLNNPENSLEETIKQTYLNKERRTVFYYFDRELYIQYTNRGYEGYPVIIISFYESYFNKLFEEKEISEIIEVFKKLEIYRLHRNGVGGSTVSVSVEKDKTL